MSNKNIVHSFIRRSYGLEKSKNFQLMLFKDRLSIAKNLFKRDLVSHYGCVNAIEFSQEGNWLTSGWWTLLIAQICEPIREPIVKIVANVNLDFMRRACDNEPEADSSLFLIHSGKIY